MSNRLLTTCLFVLICYPTLSSAQDNMTSFTGDEDGGTPKSKMTTAPAPAPVPSLAVCGPTKSKDHNEEDADEIANRLTDEERDGLRELDEERSDLNPDGTGRRGIGQPGPASSGSGGTPSDGIPVSPPGGPGSSGNGPKTPWVLMGNNSSNFVPIFNIPAAFQGSARM